MFSNPLQQKHENVKDQSKPIESDKQKKRELLTKASPSKNHLMGKHMIANSVQSVDGLDGVTVVNSDFTGTADVKGFGKTSIWDNEW